MRREGTAPPLPRFRGIPEVAPAGGGIAVRDPPGHRRPDPPATTYPSDLRADSHRLVQPSFLPGAAAGRVAPPRGAPLSHERLGPSAHRRTAQKLGQSSSHSKRLCSPVVTTNPMSPSLSRMTKPCPASGIPPSPTKRCPCCSTPSTSSIEIGNDYEYQYRLRPRPRASPRRPALRRRRGLPPLPLRHSPRRQRSPCPRRSPPRHARDAHAPREPRGRRPHPRRHRACLRRHQGGAQGAVPVLDRFLVADRPVERRGRREWGPRRSIRGSGGSTHRRSRRLIHALPELAPTGRLWERAHAGRPCQATSSRRPTRRAYKELAPLSDRCLAEAS